MLRRLLQPFWVLLAIVFLIEAWLWDHLEPVVAKLVAWLPLRQFKQWLSDRVDGFDASFSGWGREDSDLLIRLLHAGVRRKDGRFATGVVHLWHPEIDRAQLAANDARLAGAEMRGTANRPDLPATPNCRGSCRSKMSTINPVEQWFEPSS